jgi:hypothetical protein
LQRAEKLTGRLAAGAVRMRLDWKYLLGPAVDDPGFDHAVLTKKSSITGQLTGY